jgi:hypothetical protein
MERKNRKKKEIKRNKKKGKIEKEKENNNKKKERKTTAPLPPVHARQASLVPTCATKYSRSGWAGSHACLVQRKKTRTVLSLVQSFSRESCLWGTHQAVGT